VNKFSSTRKTFGAKTPKKCCHVDILEALVCWPLDSSVKAERTNFGSPPIKLLESLVCSTDGCSVKCPLDFVNRIANGVQLNYSNMSSKGGASGVHGGTATPTLAACFGRNSLTIVIVHPQPSSFVHNRHRSSAMVSSVGKTLTVPQNQHYLPGAYT
jgi:hypothetical protein